MKLLHKVIFWSHLLAGVIGGAVIFIMSATGVILMYEHQLVEFAERGVREVVPPDGGARRMSLDKLVAKAREQTLMPGPPAWYCATNPPLPSSCPSAAKAQPTSIRIPARF